MKAFTALLVAAMPRLSTTAFAFDRYDMDDFGYRTVKTRGRGKLVFQTRPRGAFMSEHSFSNGERIFVNVDCLEGGYALTCRNGVLDGCQLYRLARQKHLRREEKIMKNIRRLLCVSLAISMLCASALAEIELIPQSKTMYLNSRDGKASRQPGKLPSAGSIRIQRSPRPRAANRRCSKLTT